MDEKKEALKQLGKQLQQTAQQVVANLKRLATVLKNILIALKNPITWILFAILCFVIAIIGMTSVLGKNEVGYVCTYINEKGEEVAVDSKNTDNKDNKDDKLKCERIGWGKKTGTTGGSDGSSGDHASEDGTAPGAGEYGIDSSWDPQKSDYDKPNVAGHGHGTYSWGQCTWYADARRSEIGKPMPTGFMGNGGDWWKTAQSLGMSVDHTPQAGDAVSFPPGVAGADKTYGHVAFVEKVLDDGSIYISESNAKGLGVISFRIVPASSIPYCYFIH